MIATTSILKKVNKYSIINWKQEFYSILSETVQPPYNDVPMNNNIQFQKTLV